MEVKPFEFIEDEETERFLWATETECPVCGHEVRIRVEDVLDYDDSCTGDTIEFWRTLVIAECQGCFDDKKIVFDLILAEEYASKDWIEECEAEHKAAQDIECGRTPRIKIPPREVPYLARFSFIQEKWITHAVAITVLKELATRNTQQASS